MAPHGPLLLLLLSLSAALASPALGPSRLSSGASIPEERGILERETLAVPSATAWGPGRVAGGAAIGSAVQPSDAAALLSAAWGPLQVSGGVAGGSAVHPRPAQRCAGIQAGRQHGRARS